MSEIPNVFFLYWSGSTFSIRHYICLKSIFKIEKPDEIFLYYNDPIPEGNIWWERCKALVTLKKLTQEEFPEYGHILDKSICGQMTSDFFSALVLYKYGGIYMDFDTITIKSMRDKINGCDAFISSCRNATATYNHKSNKFTSVKKHAKRWSYLCIGILGSKSGHPYYHQVLESFQNKEYEIGHETGQLHYINTYETNKDNFPNLRVVPWAVFNSISERSRNVIGTIESGGASSKVENFLQNNCAPNDDIRVFHYYSSTGDCAHLVNKLLTPYMLRYSNSTYSRYASPYVDEFMPEWENDCIIAPDRKILEQKIIPHLTGNVCFVGVAPYVKHYWSEIFSASVNVTTVDNNPDVTKYGSSNHIVVEAKKMDEKIRHNSLDYVVMHTIAGFGSYTRTQLRFALRGAFRCLKPGGIIVYGWINHAGLIIISPEHLLKKTFETDSLKMVKFHDLPVMTYCNNYIDPNIEYNVPIDEFKEMDVRFIFWQKPRS